MAIDFGNKILNISAQLFIEQGLESIGMEDISNEANVPIGELRKKYKTKEEIVSALSTIYFKLQEKSCNEVPNFKDCKEEFTYIMEHCSIYLKEFNPSVVSELENNYPKIWLLYIDHRDKVIIGKIRTNIIKGIQDGVYREDLDVDISAKICIGQLQFAFDKLIFPLEDYSLGEILNIIIKNQLYSICK